MNRFLPILVAALPCAVAAPSAMAEEPGPPPSLAAGMPLDAAADSATAIDDGTLERLRTRLAETLPGMTPTSIAATPVPGLFELVVDGQIYYVGESGEYLLDGSLIDLGSRTNLTERRLGRIQSAMIDEIGEENMLIYRPEKPTGRFITVFTDISCGYCRKLHEGIGTLLGAGVSVRYLLFPRAGLGSPAHADLESVWCAPDPQAALTEAKRGGHIEPATCDNPIESHVALAERVGLRGTPLIYLDDGERVPGYREPSALVAMIRNSVPLTHASR